MPNGNEGKPLCQRLITQMRRMRRDRVPIRTIAALLSVSPTTVDKYTSGLFSADSVDRELDWQEFDRPVEVDYSEGVRET